MIAHPDFNTDSKTLYQLFDNGLNLFLWTR